MVKIKFQGADYVLVGDLDGGAIATEEAYANGECSYAHLGEDGIVRRFHEEIGTVGDISVIGTAERPDSTLHQLLNIIDHPSWDQR